MEGDERIQDLLRRAGAADAPPPDLDRVYRRAWRRRAVRWTVAAVAAVAVTGSVIEVLPSARTVRFADGGEAGRSTTAAGADDRTAGSAGATAGSQERPAVDALPPEAEGLGIAVGGGFLMVSGSVPSSVWFSGDARTWVEQPARGLGSDLPYDIAATPDGVVGLLDVDRALWVSDDRGASWERVDLPAAAAKVEPLGLGADRSHWYIAARAGERLELYALARDAPEELVRVELGGDATLDDASSWSTASLHVASATHGTVVALNRPTPVLWHIADDLTATRVAAPFGTGRVTGVGAEGDVFTATVLDADDPDAALDLWESGDGVEWSVSETRLPVPTCAQVIGSGETHFAFGGPCDADAGWDTWRQDAAGRWEQTSSSGSR